MPPTSSAFDIYHKYRSRSLNFRHFANPPAVYRGAPFWSWNTFIRIPQLRRQIDQFAQMGFGGFHIHSRVGLADEYLGRKYMEAVRVCTEHAQRRGMLNWLYDEDRWPSGFAGGLVTRDPRFRMKYLRWTPFPYGSVPHLGRSESGCLLGRFAVILRNGWLADYRRLDARDTPPADSRLWYAYLETADPTPRYNHQTNVDTFNRQAIERFIEVTHERFKAVVGDAFGDTIPAIFTDEPQFQKKQRLQHPDDLEDVLLPWTDDFADTYRAAYGQDIEAFLPELIWELPNGRASLVRYRYHDHTAERFASAFGDTLARWCRRNGIALTGHMLAESDLHGQTRGGGEVMRAMRSFHIPGIDILCDRIEFITAKQAQSLAHQNGCPGVLSELYGVTGWDFDFAGFKRQGDWQTAMGVTVRVPHLAWVSMAGEAKRDYPPAIGYQSPWYSHYALVEDHFARVNAIMTRGTPLIRVGMIHPIESSWLTYGVISQTCRDTQELEVSFKTITNWLAFGLIDFNYIAESNLAKQSAEQRGKRFQVGKMRYDAVIVPPMRTIRQTTLNRLQRFSEAGGKVIFVGKAPSLVDAKPSTAAQRLARHCTTLPFSERALLEELASLREVSAELASGTASATLLHQIRVDGRQRHFFFCNIDRDKPQPNTLLRFTGRWDATLRDTATGTSRRLPAHDDPDKPGSTLLRWDFPAHGHLLVTLTPRQKARPLPARPATQPVWREINRLEDPVPVTLSEPNVLLLDQAQWRLEGQTRWQPAEELLRIDNIVRQRLGLPRRGGGMAQPWTDIDPDPVVSRLQLRFIIQSDVTVPSPQLALENAAATHIELDDRRVPSRITGWWVDEAIQTVRLPRLSSGRHELVLTLPLSRKMDVEWCYLLGDFGVTLAGRHARLIAPVRKLAFGDWTTQGLPFYVGNVTYHCRLTTTGEPVRLEVPHFRNPLLTVALNGRSAGTIAFAPFHLELSPRKGRHRLDITAFGHRANAFGPVHHTDDNLRWIGPDAWRSRGPHWTYGYRLKRMGILDAPIISARE